MSDFVTATNVEEISPGRLTARFSPDWRTLGPAGGYQAAIALRAAGKVAKIPRPVSFHCHFLRVAKFEQVDIAVETLHAGRASESLRISITQDGKRILEAMTRTASQAPGVAHIEGGPPEAPDPEQLRAPLDINPEYSRGGFSQHIETRVVDEGRLLDRASPRAAQQLDWYRFGPGAPYKDVWLDAARMTMLVDTMTHSPAFLPHPGGAFVAPSIECQVWFHQFAPESEWLLADHIAPIADGGLIGVHGKVWSHDRRLLASGGAQLLCAPRPQA
ncbi:MAG: thioesterase family protein [Caulobacterales bacterium]